ncbi:hypothetical protein [Nitrobacter hamburgensis]|uniref:ATP dependent DNA ligase n=1 Tax=Nitrobacter hamburgensis TaxID=912 RepID=UPI0009D70CF6
MHGGRGRHWRGNSEAFLAAQSSKPMLTKPIRKPKATWVEPTFYADIEYRDLKSEGLLRASSFKRLSR